MKKIPLIDRILFELIPLPKKDSPLHDKRRVVTAAIGLSVFVIGFLVILLASL